MESIINKKIKKIKNIYSSDVLVKVFFCLTMMVVYRYDCFLNNFEATKIFKHSSNMFHFRMPPFKNSKVTEY